MRRSRFVAIALLLGSTATPLAAQGVLETRRTYHGCDVQDGVTLSCATIQFHVFAFPRAYDFGTLPPTPVGNFWFGWESLGSSATFFTAGNLDPARSALPIAPYNRATFILPSTLVRGSFGLQFGALPGDVALIDPATWPALLNTLDQPWTMAAYYGPEGALVPTFGSPLPAGWTSRTFTMHVTPEPGTLALLLSGLGAVAVVARRRRARTV